MEEASLPSFGKREEPCKQCQAVSRIPLEVSVAWLPLAECQDMPRQKHCPVCDPDDHKCCKIAGIKSKSKHYRYKKAGDPAQIFPNLLLSEMQIDRPMQCIVSNLTAFNVKGTYYELTLYMDLWNNEIVIYSLSAKRGDRMTYISGLRDLIAWKEQHPEHQMILHTDQGSVYASKAYNDLLPMYGITRSMSRAGTPTDNAAMESVNGWIKAEMFMDLHVTGEKSIAEEVDDYIHFFNEYRPAYTLGYLTPKQYRERHISKC